MTDELKPLPCPWCGREARVSMIMMLYKVKCKNDECEFSKAHASPEMAIESWNKRHEPEKKSGQGKSVVMYRPILKKDGMRLRVSNYLHETNEAKELRFNEGCRKVYGWAKVEVEFL